MNELALPAAPPSSPSSSSTPVSSGSKPPRKRFVGASTSKASSSKQRVRVPVNQVPDEILNDEKLNAAIEALPRNYNFEIHKTVHQLRRDNITSVALQMPEGLMIYGCLIGDILEQFTSAHPILLADVTYGACCIDDFTARSLGAEMIVHYGHSCLIPTTQTLIKTLYVFVEIGIDADHLHATIRASFPPSKKLFLESIIEAPRRDAGTIMDIVKPNGLLIKASTIEIEQEAADIASSSSNQHESTTSSEEEIEVERTHLALVSTIQFVSAIQNLRTSLESPLPLPPSTEAEVDINPASDLWQDSYKVSIPQSRPLSPGEILGCTAPKLSDVDALIYIGDGRFHLESIMIANPQIPAFRYDPYSKKFTREFYEHEEMRDIRAEAVQKAKDTLGNGNGAEGKGDGAGGWGVVLGTLGRQGSLSVLNNITSSLPPSSHPPLPILLSELSPAKLSLFPSALRTFVQTSCPRLSIDWGYAFPRPLLTPYEANVVMGKVRQWDKSLEGQGYPMDFYADDSSGPWTPRNGLARPKRN